MPAWQYGHWLSHIPEVANLLKAGIKASDIYYVLIPFGMTMADDNEHVIGNLAGQTMTDPTLAAALTLFIASTDNAQDKAGGTGALKASILATRYAAADLFIQELTLNGTTQVALNTDISSIITAWISDTGSGLVPVGDIKIGTNLFAAYHGIIDVTVGGVCKQHMDIARFFCPAGISAKLLRAKVTDSTQTGKYALRIRNGAETTVANRSVLFPSKQYVLAAGASHDFAPFNIPPYGILEMTQQNNGAGVNCVSQGFMEILAWKNTGNLLNTLI